MLFRSTDSKAPAFSNGKILSRFIFRSLFCCSHNNLAVFSFSFIVFSRCVILEAKEAEDKHLLLVHSINHVNLIKNISSKQFNSRRHKIASKLGSIYFNEGSSEAAYLAAGSAVEVVFTANL